MPHMFVLQNYLPFPRHTDVRHKLIILTPLVRQDLDSKPSVPLLKTGPLLLNLIDKIFMKGVRGSFVKI